MKERMNEMSDEKREVPERPEPDNTIVGRRLKRPIPIRPKPNVMKVYTGGGIDPGTAVAIGIALAMIIWVIVRMM